MNSAYICLDEVSFDCPRNFGILKDEEQSYLNSTARLKLDAMNCTLETHCANGIAVDVAGSSNGETGDQELRE